MARFHIRKDGTPGQCHAKPGNCPLGGEGQHYPTMEAAQATADAQHMDGFMSDNQSAQVVESRPESLTPEEYSKQLSSLSDADIDNMSEEDVEKELANAYASTEGDFDAEEGLNETAEFNEVDAPEFTDTLRKNGVLNENQSLVNLDELNVSKYAEKHSIQNVGTSSDLYKNTNFPTSLPEGPDAYGYAVVDKSTNTVSPVNMGQLTHIDYLSRGNTQEERMSSMKTIMKEERDENRYSQRPESRPDGAYNKYVSKLSDKDIDNLSPADAQRIVADAYEQSDRDYAVNAEEGLLYSEQTPAEWTNTLRKENVLNDNQSLVNMTQDNDSVSEYAKENNLSVGKSADLYTQTKFPPISPDGYDSTTYGVLDKNTNTITPINMGQVTHVDYLVNRGNNDAERLTNMKQVIKEDRDNILENS